jgi:hypothetical protein
MMACAQTIDTHFAHLSGFDCKQYFEGKELASSSFDNIYEDWPVA